MDVLTFDPFNTDQDANDNTTETQAPNATVHKPQAVPDNDGKVVVTLKGGSSFESPWIVIHAADVADATNQLADPSLRNLIERTADVGRYFASKGGGAKTGGGSAEAKDSTGRPQAATEAPNGEKRFCKHGERVYRSGSKNGKTWEAYFCATPKGTADQCAPEWA